MSKIPSLEILQRCSCPVAESKGEPNHHFLFPSPASPNLSTHQTPVKKAMSTHQHRKDINSQDLYDFSEQAIKVRNQLKLNGGSLTAKEIFDILRSHRRGPPERAAKESTVPQQTHKRHLVEQNQQLGYLVYDSTRLPYVAYRRSGNDLARGFPNQECIYVQNGHDHFGDDKFAISRDSRVKGYDDGKNNMYITVRFKNQHDDESEDSAPKSEGPIMPGFLGLKRLWFVPENQEETEPVAKKRAKVAQKRMSDFSKS